MKNFFESASELTSHVEVSLCAGQGGTPLDSVKRLPFNSWKVC